MVLAALRTLPYTPGLSRSLKSTGVFLCRAPENVAHHHHRLNFNVKCTVWSFIYTHTAKICNYLNYNEVFCYILRLSACHLHVHSCSGTLNYHLPGPSRLVMLIADPPLWPPWALFSCCSRRSSWNTRELFSVPRASSIVCFWISVSVSWWRRFSSSVWLLLIALFVSWKPQQW